MSESQFVSINPAQAVAGGSLIDDADVIVRSVRTGFTDYNGTIQVPVPALLITYQTADGAVQQQFYSAGDQKNFVPSDDQRRFVRVGKQTGLGETTNALGWILSAINSGFPADKVGDDVSVFDGMECHITKVPQPKRSFAQGTAAPVGGEKTYLVVSKIHKLPWENKGMVAAAPMMQTSPMVAAAPAPVPAQPSAPAANLHGKATQTVMAILISKGGQIAKAQIAQEAFSQLAKDPERNAVVQMIYNDAFLSGAMGAVTWQFDGTTIKL